MPPHRWPLGPSAIRWRLAEQLERDVWPDPGPTTDLVAHCHRLRKVPLGELTAENLRLMIGQKIGWLYLVPLALDLLEADPWVAGDYREGDLLRAVSKVDPAFWIEQAQFRGRLDDLVSQVQERMAFFNTEVLPAYQKIYGG